MPIPVTCSTCQKFEEVPDSFAGKRVTCQTCGTKIDITRAPSARPVDEDFNENDVVGYAGASQHGVQLSKSRRLAARASIGLGVLIIVLSLCIAAAMAVSQPVGGNFRARNLAMTGATLIVGVMAISGLVYLITGLRIRRGAFASVIICLSLASLQGLFALLNFAVNSLAFVVGGFRLQSMISWAISVIVLAALIQLIYFLIKTLMEYKRPTLA